jgi:hypothetical protein
MTRSGGWRNGYLCKLSCSVASFGAEYKADCFIVVSTMSCVAPRAMPHASCYGMELEIAYFKLIKRCRHTLVHIAIARLS